MSPVILATFALAAALLLLPARPGAAVRLERLTTPGATRRSRRRWLARLAALQVRPECGGLVVAVACCAVGGWPRGVLLSVPAGLLSGWLLRRGRRRARSGGAADPLRLAATWDLLAACLRAGLPVASAVRAVAGSAPDTTASALSATADLLHLGADPVDAWAPAERCADTAELARAARRTARSGSALAQVATDLAGRLRGSLGAEAEARAQRAGVLITGPLGLCFLPAFLCLGVVPVVLGLATELTVFR